MVWARRAQHRLDCWRTQSNVVERKEHCKKTWDEVLVDDSNEHGMESGDPQNWTGWRERLRVRLVRKTQPSVEENWL